MKWIAIFLTLTASIATFPALAAENSDPKRPVWTEAPSAHPAFSKVYELKGLEDRSFFADVRSDGRGITLVLRDINRSLRARVKDLFPAMERAAGKYDDKLLLEQIDITLGDNGKVSVTVNKSSARFEIEGILPQPMPDDDAPELLEGEFLEAAKLLPTEVQNLFFGRYGIGSPAK